MEKRILTEIWIYPVKAMAGIRLRSARVMEKGLQHDRRWMLVDESGMFMTQRTTPPLALFKPEFRNDSFLIRFGTDSVILPFDTYIKEQPIEAMVWDDKVTVFEVSAEVSDWVSKRLDAKCRLVAFPEENPRAINRRYNIDLDSGRTSHVSLADGYPLLIIGQTSLDELNERLEKPIPMNRFRPNLVFTGGSAHEEDHWIRFSIGRNRFAGVKPCARCPVPTIDQETAVRGKEPLTTLARYRRKDDNVYFGQNVIAIDHDEIHEGDEIVF